MAFAHPLSRHNRGEHPVRKEKKEASDYSFIMGSRWARSVVILGGPSRGQDDHSHKCKCSPSRRYQLHPNTITRWPQCCWDAKGSRAKTELLVWNFRFQHLCLWHRGRQRTNDSTRVFHLQKKTAEKWRVYRQTSSSPQIKKEMPLMYDHYALDLQRQSGLLLAFPLPKHTSESAASGSSLISHKCIIWWHQKPQSFICFLHAPSPHGPDHAPSPFLLHTTITLSTGKKRTALLRRV